MTSPVWPSADLKNTLTHISDRHKKNGWALEIQNKGLFSQTLLEFSHLLLKLPDLL